MYSCHHVSDRSNIRSQTVWSRGATIRLLPLLFFWWVLTQGDSASWVIGIPTVLFATIVSVWLSASSFRAWRLNAFLRFASLFVYYSLKSGVDVARRAFSPGLPLGPVMLEHSLRLPEGTARVFFANIVSLLPGTLSADIRSATLMVHVLDGAMPVVKQMQRLEVTVAQLFGCPTDSERTERTEA